MQPNPAAVHLLVCHAAVSAAVLNQDARGLAVAVLDGKQQRRGAVLCARIDKEGAASCLCNNGPGSACDLM